MEVIYKPEYLIPQLLIEWIIKQAQKTNKNKRINEIIGVYYTSSHINQEFNYPLRKSDNVAIPVIDPLVKNEYCPMLSKLFSITKPLNIEIEKLKHIKIDCGTFDNKTEQEQQIENYETSDLNYLEKRLDNIKLNNLYLQN